MRYVYLLCMAAVAFFAACPFKARAATYNLTVQANRQTHEWNKFYEKGVATDHQYTLITSYWKRGIGKALQFGHDSAGFQYWRGHAVLDGDVGLVTAATANTLTLNWTKFDAVYDTGLAVGMHPICEISCTPLALASNPSATVSADYNGAPPNKSPPTKYGWGQWVALMDSIVTHCEKRYGVHEVRDNWYFEVWNEPNWWYSSFPEYITLFDYTVYGLKLADSLVRVGGPACQGNYTFQNDAEISKLLNHCHSGYDSATGKQGTKIDFLTYHCYADNPMTIGGIQGSTLNPNTDPAVHRMIVDSMKNANYSWFTGPIFEDETGPTVQVPVWRDMQQSASWLARTVHLLNEGGPNYPPPGMLAYWAISDIYEEGMNSVGTLSFEQGNYGMMCRGAADYANSWDIPKPVFQAYRLLHKLGAFEDSSTGGVATTVNAVINGVGLIATSSDTGGRNDSIQILVYDHYASTTQSSARTDSIFLTVNNIPWAPGQVRVEHFLVDTTHGNTFTKWVSMGKPAAPSNAQWDELRKASDPAHYDSVTTTALTGATFIKGFSTSYYSVNLIVLSNPRVVSVKKLAEADAAPGALHAVTGKGKIILDMPWKGRYIVSLYTTAGQKIFEGAEFGPGNALVSVPKMPAGVFVLQCRGEKGTLLKKVIARP